MTSPARLITAVVSTFAAAVLIAGCTSAPGSDAPTSSPAPSAPSAGTGDQDDMDDFEGALLDDGRMFAVITYGSSTCVPQVSSVSAQGQTVAVELLDAEGDVACTADMAPRASVGALPEGIDPNQEITLQVTYGDRSDDVDLDTDAPVNGVPGTSTEYLPSAGWFDDNALVLLTWGSSTCVPVVEAVEGAGNAGTVTFATATDQPCTMDMAPRATIIAFDADTSDDDFTLTLVGDNLDGTVKVLGS